MATLFLIKRYDSFFPADQVSADAMEKLKWGAEYKAEVTQPRNIGFHRKFFKLLETAYDIYEQPEVFHNGVRVFKSPSRFREEITIACGYWELELNKNNNVIQRAKSISFASMNQIEFEELFSAAIDVILRDYLTNYSKPDLVDVTKKILAFD